MLLVVAALMFCQRANEYCEASSPHLHVRALRCDHRMDRRVLWSRSPAVIEDAEKSLRPEETGGKVVRGKVKAFSQFF